MPRPKGSGLNVARKKRPDGTVVAWGFRWVCKLNAGPWPRLRHHLARPQRPAERGVVPDFKILNA